MSDDTTNRVSTSPIAADPETFEFDLDQSTRGVKTSGPTGGGRPLQDAAWREIASRLSGRINAVDALPPDGRGPSNVRVHNTLLLDGSRGSGKTTFIHEVRAALSTPVAGLPKNDPRAELAALGPSIHVLEPLDPTLLEDAEHPIITLVERIDRAVNSNEPAEKGLREAYAKARRDLADSLCVLDKVGKDRLYDDWEDPAVVANKSLGRAKSGARLAERLETFARHAARALGKKAFLIFFDDIDTQFDRGWPVLEAMRKYLTAPWLIVVLAGDLNLYALLVRRAQIVNLGTDLLRHDRAHRDHHPETDLVAWQGDRLKRMVDGLESQYLLKVLLPQNRVTLRTLATLTESPNAVVQLVIDGQPRMTVGQAVDAIFKATLGLTRLSDLREHRQAILRQPLRTVAQFLQAGRLLILGGEAEQAKNVGQFRERFLSLASSSLQQHGLRHTELLEPDPYRLSGMVVRWFDAADLWEDGHHLRPVYGNDDTNLVALAFSLRLTALFEANRGEAYAYFIRVSMTRALMLQCDTLEQRRRVLAFLDVSTKRPLVESARRWVVAQRELLNTNETAAMGTIPVTTGRARTAKTALKALYNIDSDAWKPFDGARRLADKAVWTTYKGIAAETLGPWHNKVLSSPNRQRALDKSLYTTPDSLAELLGPAGMLLFAAAARATRYGATFTTLSPLVLLGAAAGALIESRQLAVAELEPRGIAAPRFAAELVPTKGTGEDNDAKEAEDEDAAPSGQPTNTPGTPAEDNPAEPGATMLELPVGGQGTATDVALPPQVLAAAAERFVTALGSMDETFSTCELFAGAQLAQQLSALENAFLVEEMRFRGSAVGSLKNPIRGVGPLKANRAAADRAGRQRHYTLHRVVSEGFVSLFRAEPEPMCVPTPSVPFGFGFQNLEHPMNSLPVANKVRGRWPKVFPPPSGIEKPEADSGTGGPSGATENKQPRSPTPKNRGPKAPEANSNPATPEPKPEPDQTT